MLFPCADPDNWKIDAWEFDWVNLNVIRDRAAIAHARNKPFIIEETGMKVHPQFYFLVVRLVPVELSTHLHI